MKQRTIAEYVLLWIERFCVVPFGADLAKPEPSFRQVIISKKPVKLNHPHR
jgi:hypothetical protein